MDDLIRDFVVETLESLDSVDADLVRAEQGPNDPTALVHVRRVLHTIKGTCGFLALPGLETLVHEAESLLMPGAEGPGMASLDVSRLLAAFDHIRAHVQHLQETGVEPILTGIVAAPPTGSDGSKALDLPPAQSYGQVVRVASGRLDQLRRDAFELILVRNQLADIARSVDMPALRAPLQRLSKLAGELQDNVAQASMQRIGDAWVTVPRLVRDIGETLGKDIKVETSGGETEIDRHVLDPVREAIVHLVRNGAVHGIETAAERVAHGKSAGGLMRLSAWREGGSIRIMVSDDGRGLDLEGIRRQALQLGLVGSEGLARLDDDAVVRLILEPGFSTASTVTELAGRGVGLDVVRTVIEQAGGRIDVRSAAGCGVTVEMRLPLAASVVQALIVSSAGQRFAIPQLALVEILRPGSRGGGDIVASIDQNSVLSRGLKVPLVNLAAHFGSTRPGNGPGVVLVCENRGARFGLVVDAVERTEHLVVTTLPLNLQSLPCYAGAALLGDGSPVLLLEPAGFSVAKPAQLGATEPTVEIAATPGHGAKVLAYRSGDQQMRMVALSDIARIEVFDMPERAAHGATAVRYRDGDMPIIASHATELTPGRRLPVLVVENGERLVGVAVEEIGAISDAGVSDAANEMLDIERLIAGAGLEAPVARHNVVLLGLSDFTRELLMPLLENAGFSVETSDQPDMPTLAKTARALAVVVDVDAVDAAFINVLGAHLSGSSGSQPAVLALASRRDASALERAKQISACELVGTFDRQRLVNILKALVQAGGIAA